MTDFFAVIPARYGSTRLPGKPLRLIAGEIMVAHVYARALESGAAGAVVATDDQRVLDACHARGIDALLTSDQHRSGTDRCAEVAMLRGWGDDTIVVNVQGDEPLIPPQDIRLAAAALSDSDADIATLACPLADEASYADPNVVKVVRARNGHALLFSRAPVPWQRDGQNGWHSALRHVGLYAYRAATLRALTALPPCELERIESLEQLRALWHGLTIQVAITQDAPAPGVDTESDLDRVAAWLARDGAGS